MISACMLSRFSCVQFCVTPRTVACQAPLSVGSFRQEYWSRLPFPSPGDLPDPGIEPTFLGFPALAASLFITSATWEAQATCRKPYNRRLAGPGFKSKSKSNDQTPNSTIPPSSTA